MNRSKAHIRVYGDATPFLKNPSTTARGNNPGPVLVRSSPSATLSSGQLKGIVAEKQKTLIIFLGTDLDLSFTILKAAALATSVEYARLGLERVRHALRAIRGLITSIEDPVSREEICQRADYLQRCLESFPLTGGARLEVVGSTPPRPV